MNQNTATAVPTVSRKADAIADLGSVYGLVQDEFRSVNQLIPQQLSSDVAMVADIGNYIVESGGKRLRPLIVLLSSQALGYPGDQHIPLATIIEFLHTATLLHDDVVDHSGLRRGKPTANQKWGNAPSVLVGDFLYSRAFQLMVELGSLDIMAVLARATNTIAEGEVMQLANLGNCDLNETAYREVIRCKTALLFEAASHTGAILAHQRTKAINDEQIEAMRLFGLHFGMAYQLLDDWLDYRGDSKSMGKNVGDDLAEGKLTLPLIHALQNAATDDQAGVRDAIENKKVAALPSILRIVDRCGGLDYTQACARQEIETALQCLEHIPDNDYRQALVQLSHYSLSRLG